MEEVTRKQFISFIVPLAMTMVIIVCFSIVIAKKRSEMKAAFTKKVALERDLALLRRQNMELHKLMDGLTYDPVQVEKEAREQLGYAKPKERLYKTYNFRVLDNAAGDEMRAGGRFAGADEGILKKIGLFGIFILIIAGVTGAFYVTYWYECKHRRIRS